jgi:urease accessory protein
MSMSTTTRIEAELREGRTVATVLAGGDLVRPRVVGRGGAGALRVALVQTAACLLTGDELSIEVAVGPGAALELIEPAATIAHHGRGGPPARWSARVDVEGSLRWTAAPFIVADGAAVERSLRVDVAAGGRALLRDLLVLGRAGEAPGRLHARTELRHAGRPLLVEALDTGDLALLRSAAVLGSARILDTIALIGAVPPPAPDTWRLPGEGALRSLPAVSAAAADAAAAPVLREWGSVLDGGSQVGHQVLAGLDPA